MKVLVVGGAGYIGSHTVLELLSNKHEVVVFDDLSTGHIEFIPNGVRFYKGSLTNKEDLKNVFDKEKSFSCVMHFAAKIVVPASMADPLLYYHNNVEGVRLLLEQVRDYKVPFVIFSSSAAVYGEPSTGECFENDPKLPINPYGETKLVCENMIKWCSKAYGFKYINFRYFNVAGADSKLRVGQWNKVYTHLIPICTETMLGKRDKLTIAGNDYKTSDGTNIRDYIHVEDLAKAHVIGLHYLISGGPSDDFNLGSNVGFSVYEVAKECNKIMPMKYDFGPRRGGDPDKLIANSRKALEILGFRPEKTLKEMIKSDLDYRKSLK